MSFKKEVLGKLKLLEDKLHLLNRELITDHRLIETQKELITELRGQLNKVLDRLMSRNFQELSLYTPFPQTDPMPTSLEELEESLIGTVVEDTLRGEK